MGITSHADLSYEDQETTLVTKQKMSYLVMPHGQRALSLVTISLRKSSGINLKMGMSVSSPEDMGLMTGRESVHKTLVENPLPNNNN